MAVRRGKSLRYSRSVPAPRVVAARGVFVNRASADSAPPLPTPHPRVPLSPLDSLVFTRALSVSSCFFFPGLPNVDLLCSALSFALGHFPVIAGRVDKAADTSPPINAEFDFVLNDRGVPLDEWACDGGIADFDAWNDWARFGQHTQFRSNFKPPKFVPQLDSSACFAPNSDAPLACCRITSLRDGWVLSTTFAHSLLDGASSLLFMDAWSKAAQCLATNAPMRLPLNPPIFDRSVLVAAANALPADAVPEEEAAKAAKEEADAIAGLVASITPRKLVGRLLKLGRDALFRKNASYAIRLPSDKLEAARRIAAARGSPVSANDVIVGVAWALLRTVRSRGPASQPRLCPPNAEHSASHQFLFQAVDLRRFLPDLPPTYFGNASWAVRVSSPAATSAAPDPITLAAASRAALKTFVESGAAFRTTAAVLARAASSASSDGRAGLALLLPAFGDGMMSSWWAPATWTYTFGHAPPVWQWAAVVPSSSWGLAVSAGRPDSAPRPGASPDFILAGSCPAHKLHTVRAAAARILAEACGEAAPAAPVATAKKQQRTIAPAPAGAAVSAA